MDFPAVYLKKGKERSVQRLHPWVFSGAIQRMDQPEPKGGDIVTVLDTKGNFLALGHYHRGAIAVRIFSFEEVAVDREFWKAKLHKALDLRTQLGLPAANQTTAFRLVHGEGDGFPGLVIDIYNQTAVVQTFSAGMHQLKPVLTEFLSEAPGLNLTAVYDKSGRSMSRVSDIPIEESYLWQSGAPDRLVFEHGVRFNVDWEGGQKTGFFLDQRNNRELIRTFAQGKRVLNTYSYSGGFSIYALLGGAKQVTSVDSSAAATALVEENLTANDLTNAPHSTVTEDTVKYLKGTTEDFDLIVLDPPAFAKSISARHRAVQAYKRINRMALEKLSPGGILFTFSCSEVVDRQLFQNTVMSAAIEAGRAVRILHYLSQPADHPVSIFHPEGAYLKGLVLQVG